MIHPHSSCPNLLRDCPPQELDKNWSDVPLKSRKIKKRKKSSSSSSSEERHKPKKSKKSPKKKSKKRNKKPKKDISSSSMSSSDSDSDSCLDGRTSARKLSSGSGDLKHHPDWVFVSSKDLSAYHEWLTTEINVHLESSIPT